VDDGFAGLCARGAFGSREGLCRSGKDRIPVGSELGKKVRRKRGLERRGKWESWEEQMRSSCQKEDMVM